MDEERKPLLMRTSTYNVFSLANGNLPNDLHVERPVYGQEELHLASEYEKPTVSIGEAVRDKYNSCSCKTFLQQLIPVLKWLPEYNWKQDITGDIISGITVAIMHIPQGIAYSLLGNVPPAVGIYMAFFPVIIYFFFGTSRHVSMGTFAIVCLMTGKVVSQYSTEEKPPESVDQANWMEMLTHNQTDNGVIEHQQYPPIAVAITVTFAVAAWQLIMYVLRLGVISNLLSDVLVNGFTCAAACYVVVSQMKDLFGLPLKKRRGFFSLPLSIYDIVMAIPLANHTAVSISMTAIVIMVINNEIFKPWLAQRTRIPFPIELAAVLIGTASSYFGDFNAKYNVTIVGEIPTGLPAPTLPIFSLLPEIALDSLIICIVSYSISMSMAIIFASKLHYDVNPNQELFAMSLSNFFGSFFSSMPITASLSRSMIQQSVGGVSQIASIISCTLLLIVLLWIAPVFEHLPRAILASIIVVALKGMLMQCTKLKLYYKLSKWDAFVWLLTFVSTVTIGIDVGLGIGVLASFFSIFTQSHVPYTCLLGVVPNTDLYLDSKRYKGVKEIEKIKIFHYCGSLNFATKHTFKNHLSRKIGFNPNELLTKLEQNKNALPLIVIKCIIIDCSAITYVDPSGGDLLRDLSKTYEKLGIRFYVATCSGPIYETLKKCEKYDEKEGSLELFPTIHDAVLYAQMNENIQNNVDTVSNDNIGSVEENRRI
ncbi:prestin-like isoform X1 [Onthophagus taurus]|uniref:prestin-like isoform X1 n=1 Tax=Onthophagus taurus TaxID=166361 RepID=UPI0039BE0E16